MNNIMSGQNIRLSSKLRSAYAVYQAHRRGDFSNAENDIDFHNTLLEHYAKYVDVPLGESRILDLGCGQKATQTALFRADGADVTGIDVEIPTYEFSTRLFVQIVKRHGVERAIKSALRHWLFDDKFFGDLSRHYGRLVSFKELDTRVMDATDTPFEDSSFDFVSSLAVFEHIDDVPAAIKELNRILKPGGIAVITPHLFPSLSGGHNLEWIWPDQKPAENVEPWDHLRKNEHPADTFLNRLKLADYRKYFNEHMTVVDEMVSFEGEQYLSVSLQSELEAAGYSREDLLTRTITFFVRKKT